MTAIIECHQIQKKYLTYVVLDIDTLKINEAEMIGLVGNNGAGKTTLLRSILSLIKLNSGKITIESEDVALTEHWKKSTASFIDEHFLIPFLTAYEYISLVASLHGLTKADIDRFLSECQAFYEEDLFTEKKYIRNLSMGNKVKVGILSALITQPKVLILDEPFANLDPSSQTWLIKKLNDLKKSKMTMIISSHDLHHVTDISSRIILLEDGKIQIDKENSENSLNELGNYFQKN